MATKGVWSYLCNILNVLTLSPFSQTSLPFQKPLINDQHHVAVADGPTFSPPNGPEGNTFVCSYPTLVDYEPCFTHDNQSCWLRPKDPNSGLRTYNVSTDYENFFPQGITRRYTLDVANGTLHADGCENSEAKLFNNTYPGPWIEACWGDDVEVTVTNHLPCNGTTIHWHGLRQLNNVENDGVNAVTQCPIAPGDSFTYKFKAQQYGSSWYHSHYSLQYPDGLVGPLTFHGPANASYDHALDPILMSDWNHRSAFEDWSYSLKNSLGAVPISMTSILLNGQGNFSINSNQTCMNPQPVSLYTRVFQQNVRYLLRLINTSVDTIFVFSIDGHELEIVEADFVPITPYKNSSVLIGIGQRYHVVVTAKPNTPAPDGNYWIRTVPATGCETFRRGAKYTVENSTVGIIRYNAQSMALPQSEPNQFDIKCSDETYSSLKPIVPWTVPPPVSNSPELEVSLINTTDSTPYYPHDAVRWHLHIAPMWLNFSSPTILTPSSSPSNFSAELSANSSSTSPSAAWLTILISGTDIQSDPAGGIFFPLAHPIHLHGHDFALLAQSETPYNPSSPPTLQLENPPRRDVALLPANGFIIVSFKLDNPGIWLMHCHIAWHASSGLAMQILENVDRMQVKDVGALKEGCRMWDDWFDNKRDGGKGGRCNWDGKEGDRYPFQDDSGI